jgi:NADH-quinone oxidoreductase subunit H
VEICGLTADSVLTDNAIFHRVYCIGRDDFGATPWIAYTFGALGVIMLVVNGYLLLGVIFTWFERKLALAVIPFGSGSYIADLNIGVLYVVAMSGIASLAVLMAGYSSANKLALFGSMRAVAMLISYEIPLIMALLGITLLAASMSMVDVIAAQSVPYVLVAPLGVLVFLVAISAELSRSPFDQAEAESEIVAGYLTEYSGMKFGVFYLAEFSNVVLAAALFAVLFLDGWEGPILPSHLWFLIKVFGFLFVASWVRATIPRLRLDQILSFAWKFLFPLSLVNVITLAAEVIVWPEPSTGDLLLMAAINWPVAAAAMYGMVRVLRSTSRQPGLRLVPSGVPAQEAD